jgi:uncharacterized protein (UPF0218 family)
MISMKQLTPETRKLLKAPLGILIRGSYAETASTLKVLINKMNPTKIISVGDVVSENLTKHNILPQIMIVDNKVMREKIPPIEVETDQILYAKNSPGTLSNDVWKIIKRALNSDQRTKILIDGEEDLTALVAVSCAPLGSMVVYGQPHEGIVSIEVTEEKKKEIEHIIEQMEETSDENS